MTDYFSRLVRRSDEPGLLPQLSIGDGGDSTVDNPFEVIEEWSPNPEGGQDTPAPEHDLPSPLPQPAEPVDGRRPAAPPPGESTATVTTGERDEGPGSRRDTTPDPTPEVPASTAAGDEPPATGWVPPAQSREPGPPEDRPPADTDSLDPPAPNPVADLQEMDRLIYGAAGLAPPRMDPTAAALDNDPDTTADQPDTRPPAPIGATEPQPPAPVPDVRTVLEPPLPPAPPPVEAGEPDVVIDSLNIEIVEPRVEPTPDDRPTTRSRGILSSSLRSTRSLRGL